MMKALLAIDPGTNCGFAIRDEAGAIISGVWRLANSGHEGAGMRFVKLRKALNGLVNVTITQVVFEDVKRHLGTQAAHVYGGIIAHVMEWCEKRNIPYTSLPVGTIKKFATGKGNANKEAMMAAAQARWPDHQFQDDNEADARFIAEAASV